MTDHESKDKGMNRAWVFLGGCLAGVAGVFVAAISCPTPRQVWKVARCAKRKRNWRCRKVKQEEARTNCRGAAAPLCRKHALRALPWNRHQPCLEPTLHDGVAATGAPCPSVDTAASGYWACRERSSR